ncbi:MAG: abortive infection family protein, partial [Bacteroidales bacterium]|nr:abortive infection family protein [Bacteroidales bacterium]
KAYALLPNSENITEVRTLVSGLQKCATAMGEIRGDKTLLHGHKSGDIVISDPASAYFVVNAVTSIGLYLIQVYKKLYPPIEPPFESIF